MEHPFDLKFTLIAGIVRHFTGEPSDAWFGIQAVYRISLGNFVRSIAHLAYLKGMRSNCAWTQLIQCEPDRTEHLIGYVHVLDTCKILILVSIYFYSVPFSSS